MKFDVITRGIITNALLCRLRPCSCDFSDSVLRARILILVKKNEEHMLSNYNILSTNIKLDIQFINLK